MTISSVLLVTSNGFGMGHLVRQLAIKAAMPADVRCTILTLSGAAPVAIAAGAEMEYCPSYTRFDKRAWHRGYLADRIEALATEVKADAVLFDGVVPYVGLLTALRRMDVTAIWMRRGVWRVSAATWPLAYSSLFDRIIEPGDVGALRDVGPTAHRTDATRVGVITQAGPSMVSREEAARRLGVDPSKPTLLLNIGSNHIADMEALEGALAARADWNVITTRDALGRNRSGATGIGVVSGIFPLHPYLSAVDLAVTSIGYNAAHEFLACGVPVVAVPADNATDDQYARADAMQQIGAAVVSRPASGQDLLDVIWPLLDDVDRRASMADAARAFAAGWGDGAHEAVAAILSAVRRDRPTLGARLRWAMRLAAEIALAWRSTRTPPTPLTESITMDEVASGARIEHLHPGLGPEYRRRREEIARKW
jgi:hypothetical protein